MKTDRQHPTLSGVNLMFGAMQNWSDLAQGSVADAPLVRQLVEDSVAGVESCLVVGAHSLDLVTGLAQHLPRVAVVTRSIPDAIATAQAVSELDNVEVFSGGLRDLVDSDEAFDLLIAVDDLDRVQTLEGEPLTWQALLEQCRSLLSPQGRLLLGTVNELGLDHLASMRARRSGNDDADWAVLSTYDSSRPRSEEALSAALAKAGLQAASLHSSYPSWAAPTVLAQGAPAFDATMSHLLGVLAVRSAAHGTELADPSRVVRVAAEAGRLHQFAAGWIVTAGAAGAAGAGADEGAAGSMGSATAVGDAVQELVEETPEGLVRYRPAGAETVTRTSGGDSDTLVLSPDSILLSELMIDACASHDLPRVRVLLADYASWLRSQADEQGVLPALAAGAAFDNVLVTGEKLSAIAPATGKPEVSERLWRSLGHFVATLRARGSRHPWPSATDDLGLLAILGAMCGLGEPESPEDYLEAPAHDAGGSAPVSTAGLLVSIQRLTESNKALQSRAQWFEKRLNERERELRGIDSRYEKELRTEQARQETLRRHLADLKASRSFRVGRVVLSPVLKARNVARRLR